MDTFTGKSGANLIFETDCLGRALDGDTAVAEKGQINHTAVAQSYYEYRQRYYMVAGHGSVAYVPASRRRSTISRGGVVWRCNADRACLRRHGPGVTLSALRRSPRSSHYHAQ